MSDQTACAFESWCKVAFGFQAACWNTLSMITLPCLLFLNLGGVTSAQQDYAIDNTHSSIIFSISHYRIGYLYGRFNECSGRVALDQFNPDASEFKFKIQADSVDTNNDDRDTALKGNQFLDAANYPTIEFASQSVEEEDGTYNVTGKLKIKDVSKTVSIPFKLLGSGEGPMGKRRIGMLSKFTIKRSDFGIREMPKNIGDDIAITFSFQAVRK